MAKCTTSKSPSINTAKGYNDFNFDVSIRFPVTDIPQIIKALSLHQPKANMIETLVKLYEDGNIVQSELFWRVRQLKLKLPEQFNEEFSKWDKEHPENGNYVTVSITA